METTEKKQIHPKQIVYSMKRKLVRYPPLRKRKKFVIPDTVTEISEYAFIGCKYLTTIVLTALMADLSASCFEGCSNLQEIRVHPKNAAYTAIDGVLFSKDLTQLIVFPRAKKVKIYEVPDSVTEIADRAFQDCEWIESITMSDRVQKIGYAAFSHCSRLNHLRLSEAITLLQGSLFYYCKSLREITLPSNLQYIHESFCSSAISAIAIPESVIHIQSGAFSGCRRLTEIKVAAGNPVYTDYDGVLFSKNMDRLLCCPIAKKGTSYAIPDTVKIIEKFAFNSCRRLEQVDIPDSVAGIGMKAFAFCSALKSISIGNTSSWLSVEAFKWCSSLQKATLACMHIDAEAFNFCSELETAEITNSNAFIDADAFSGCNKLNRPSAYTSK
jgi:hypothetical protein